MATNNLKWVQFAGRWGVKKSNAINSPNGPAYKSIYYKGSSFKHEARSKEMKLAGDKVVANWGGVKFEPRLPICNSDNRWLMLFSHRDLRSQYEAELFRRDDPEQKYHDLSLYEFDDVITGMIECVSENDAYIWFEDVNYGGKKNSVSPESNLEIRNIKNISDKKIISSICWEKCEESNWVSFFEQGAFKGKSHFLNGKLTSSINNFDETKLNESNINSIRYCIPEGYKLILYDGTDFTYKDNTIKIIGNGRFGEIDFEINEQQKVIKSAQIVPVD